MLKKLIPLFVALSVLAAAAAGAWLSSRPADTIPLGSICQKIVDQSDIWDNDDPDVQFCIDFLDQ